MTLFAPRLKAPPGETRESRATSAGSIERLNILKCCRIATVESYHLTHFIPLLAPPPLAFARTNSSIHPIHCPRQTPITRPWIYCREFETTPSRHRHVPARSSDWLRVKPLSRFRPSCLPFVRQFASIILQKRVHIPGIHNSISWP